MTDKIEETIKEIAAKHGIAIGRNDPILILQTINDRLMQESTAAQQANLDAFKSELEEIAYQWGCDAKNKAERTLNASLAASKEAMTSTIQESAKITADTVRREVEKTINQQLKPVIKEARRVGLINMVAASMTVIAAGLALWISLAI